MRFLILFLFPISLLFHSHVHISSGLKTPDVSPVKPSAGYRYGAIDTSKLSTPGPANQDTSKFATFYVLRPANKIDSAWWYGFFIDDNLMARVLTGSRYIIKCARTGKTEIWTQNEKKSSLEINVEPGKNYYVQIDTEAGEKHGYPKLVLLGDNEGKEAFDKIRDIPLAIYDPDPLYLKPPLSKQLMSNYVFPIKYKTGFYHMQFYLPLSTRHYFASAGLGFIFNYYNKMVSTTFSEVISVSWLEDRNFDDADDFQKYISKQKGNVQKKMKKSESLKEISDDSLTSAAENTGSIYFVSEDTKPDVVLDGTVPKLEIREYQAWMYKSKLKGNKGIVHYVSFSERGLPEELHSREEMRFKIQQFMTSCEFGDFR